MAKVKDLIAGINKEYKRPLASIGVYRTGGERIATGIFQFDLASGGGFPVGKISVVYGPESSMKTSLCLKAIAAVQRDYPGKTAVFVDVEGHFDSGWAQAMGVDTESLGFVSPTSAEELIDLVERLMYAEDISLIVVDSLAAMVTTAELESPAEKAVVGNAGLAINKLYRKTGRAIAKATEEGNSPTLILINQTRMKIGVMYGDPETMPGGSSFKFASSLTVRVYGKDEMDKNVSNDKPAYKKVSVILKKWKQPIVAKASEMMIALVPIPQLGLKVGDSYDWNTVLGYLKSLGMLVKAKEGWSLVDLGTGEIICNFKTQDELKDRMYSDPPFAQMVKESIIRLVLANGDLIQPETPSE